MRKLSQLYSDLNNFKTQLNENKIDLQQSCLVKVFTSILDQNSAFNIAMEIKSILPNAKIVGAYSEQDIIFKGEDHSNATLVIVETYKNLEIISKSFSWEDKSPASLAQEVYDAFEVTYCNKKDIVHILFSNIYSNISNFVDEINKFSPQIRLTGGVTCGKLEDLSPAFLFNEHGFIKNGAIAFVARGDQGTHFVNVSTSQEALGNSHELTKVSGQTIHEIDNQPSLEWLYNYLEIEVSYGLTFEDWKLKANNDYLVHFPFMRENAGGACRYTRYDQDTDSLMTHFSNLNTGDKFQLGYVNPQKTIQESYELCSSLIDIPVESLFVYVCLFRKMFLSNCIKLDLAPFWDYEICGIYMMGEILFHGGQNNYYNGCSVFVAIAEEDKFIIPDISKIQKGVENVKNDGFFTTDDFKKHKSEHTTDFISKLQENHKRQENENILDSNFDIFNGLKYKMDKEQYGYEKICMIEIQTADATINFVGEDEYYNICRAFINFTKKTLEKERLDSDIRLYSINYKTFAISSNNTVSDSKFVKTAKVLSQAFEDSSFGISTEFSEVARFVVVLKQESPLNAGLNVLFANKDSQENFLIYDDKVEIDNTSAEELKMIEIIKRAIANNKVIPFYQGLRNNKSGKLDKYEALMRLEDETGRIYSPYFFLDISKKYKFYSKLSRKMIERSLDDFSVRTEDVSINISLYDIESPAFREWLLEQLNIFPDPTRVVLEIVETEDCKELGELYQFIDNIRATGAKVAIDDFGSGYSTFATVVDIEPNFLKIDGSIINKITENQKSLVILDTIKYLSTKMNIETIAEFVENQEIQNIVMEYDITYSQGYHFSKPSPIEELCELV